VTTVAQAAAEYIAIVARQTVQFAGVWLERAQRFVSTPRGMIITGGALLVLLLVLGRRRRL